MQSEVTRYVRLNNDKCQTSQSLATNREAPATRELVVSKHER